MRVIVSGSRDWTGTSDESVMHKAFQDLYDRYEYWASIITDPFEWVIVEGCQRGADEMAERFTTMLYSAEWTLEHHPAHWDKLGNAAGAIRNQEMLDTGVDLCLAFHRNLKESSGTLDMIERCLRAGVPVQLYPQRGYRRYAST